MISASQQIKILANKIAKYSLLQWISSSKSRNNQKFNIFTTSSNFKLSQYINKSKINQSHAFIFASNKFNYVKMKSIQQIKQQYKDQGTLKVISKACGFFMKQAWNDFKQDYKIFMKIKNIPYQNRSYQQKYLFRRIKIDMIKFGPAFFVFNIPFGFPLFYMYLTLFPQMIPSWMMVDSIHNKIQEFKQKRKKDSINYYLTKLGEDVWLPYLHQAIHKQNQSLQDLRRISCICYGDYIDGTEYLSRKLNINIPIGLVHPRISIFLVNFYMWNQLRHDYQIECELSKLTTYREKLSYKLEHELKKINLIN